MAVDRRLVWLTIALIVLWHISSLLAPIQIDPSFAPRHLIIVPLIALTHCLVSMLALWVVFSRALLKFRLLGLLIGTSMLEATFDASMEWDLRYMPVVAMALTLVCLAALWATGIRLTSPTDAVPPPKQLPRRFQFSIRGLMILTVIVALLSALAKAIPGAEVENRVIGDLIVSACFVVVSLVALTVLAGRRPVARVFFTVTFPAAVGVFAAYVLNAHHDGWIYLISSMVLFSQSLVVSLLIVRKCDIRFIRWSELSWYPQILVDRKNSISQSKRVISSPISGEAIHEALVEGSRPDLARGSDEAAGLAAGDD